jgi:hypothetical protein
MNMQTNVPKFALINAAYNTVLHPKQLSVGLADDILPSFPPKETSHV